MREEKGYIKRPKLNFIFKSLNLSLSARGTYEYLYESSGISSALFHTKARRIGEDVNSQRKIIIPSQRQLKQKGLIYFPSRSRADTRSFFICCKILSQEKDGYVVTRPWSEIIYQAEKLKYFDQPLNDFIKSKNRKLATVKIKMEETGQAARSSTSKFSEVKKKADKSWKQYNDLIAQGEITAEMFDKSDYLLSIISELQVRWTYSKFYKFLLTKKVTELSFESLFGPETVFANDYDVLIAQSPKIVAQTDSGSLNGLDLVDGVVDKKRH